MKFFLIPLLLLIFLTQFSFAQDDDEVIKIDTSLVMVPVSVYDREGNFIALFKKEDFQVFENGSEQDITHFDTIEAPFTIALVLDVSDSTVFKLQEIQEAAIAFTGQLRPVDKVAVFSFDKNVYRNCDATTDRGKIAAAIRSTRTGGGTSLYEAVETVAGQYFKRVRGRKAIVLFTDGIDTTSVKNTYSGTLRSAEEMDAMIFPIQYDTTGLGYTKSIDLNEKPGRKTYRTIVTRNGEFLSVAYKRGTQYLRLLSTLTNGKFQFSDSVGELRAAFSRIAEQLKQQYGIGYYPQNQSAGDKKRAIKVKLKGYPKARLRYRDHYIFQPKTN